MTVERADGREQKTARDRDPSKEKLYGKRDLEMYYVHNDPRTICLTKNPLTHAKKKNLWGIQCKK